MRVYAKKQCFFNRFRLKLVQTIMTITKMPSYKYNTNPFSQTKMASENSFSWKQILRLTQEALGSSKLQTVSFYDVSVCSKNKLNCYISNGNSLIIINKSRKTVQTILSLDRSLYNWTWIHHSGFGSRDDVHVYMTAVATSCTWLYWDARFHVHVSYSFYWLAGLSYNGYGSILLGCSLYSGNECV